MSLHAALVQPEAMARWKMLCTKIASMRLFARLSLDSALPDRTTIMNFRHPAGASIQLARQLFKTISRWLPKQAS
uniref:transposase n=1 Tax=Escherichia coli TaxID=562 RepID=UPI003D3206FA